MTLPAATKPESMNPKSLHPETSEILTESHPSRPESEDIADSRGFGVAASPFNGIKIELGFAILLGAIVWLAADSITANAQTQWLTLLGYGVASMTWLMLRTRAVLRRCLANDEVSQ